jgi:dihydropteroate synthase
MIAKSFILTIAGNEVIGCRQSEATVESFKNIGDISISGEIDSERAEVMKAFIDDYLSEFNDISKCFSMSDYPLLGL